MRMVADFFSLLMDWCYHMVPNHWIDIVIFTIITKVLLYPLSIWGHRNSLAMVAVMPEINEVKVRYFGDDDRINEESVKIFKKNHYHPLLSLVPLAIQVVILMGFVDVIYRITASNPSSLLAKSPVKDGGVAWTMPLCAGAAAWLLGWCQNKIHPLQREQSRRQQILTNMISICISLSLGCFVGIGVGLYWVCSNLFSILVQVACNMTLWPSKYIDYKRLKSSKKELEKLEELGIAVVSRNDKLREKRDYKRFFKIANKHIVFYSEASGFYKYFKNTIAWLLEHSNLVIHYVTNDPADQIFEIAQKQPRIKPYYIGQMRIITLMMKMDADVVVMTTPDLDRYHIKRSYVRKDVQYVYTPHGIGSAHMTVREKAHANFDAIFCGGEEQFKEQRALEMLYGTKMKELPMCGYGLLDDMIEQYAQMPKAVHPNPIVMIAPSHQPDNIMDSCLFDLIDSLYGRGYKIVVRPHPQYKKRYPARLNGIVERYAGKVGDDLVFETDFSSNTTVLEADVLICDWSGIAFEYAFASLRPVISINTPIKVINPNYKAINMQPLDITLREEVGVCVELSQVNDIEKTVKAMLAESAKWKARIEKVRDATISNIGKFGETSGEYLLNYLINKQNGAKQ